MKGELKKLLQDVRWWINLFPNVMSEKVCDEIMKYPWDWVPSKYEGDKGVSSNSEERVKMDETWVTDINKPHPDIRKSVMTVMNLYSEKHENFSCIRHTDFRINRYPVGGFMSKHCDNIHHSHGQQYGYPQVSVLLFLNEDYEGGEIIIAGDNQYKPLKGSAIIFPSNFMFPHEVKKITSGTRWSIITWLM